VTNSVDKMTATNEAVKQGASLAAEAGRALTEIVQANQKAAELVKDISNSTTHANEGTQQLTAANEQITSTIQQISTAAQELSIIAGELQTDVSKFQI
ncbi:methyl-accepting chemotaxis protein, partial [Peptococcaceae bacterium 1198_IL3148]